MLDIRFIRENPEVMKNDLRRRGALNKITWIDKILEYDKEWRRLLTKANGLRKRRNKITEEIRKLVREEKSGDIATYLLKYESELKRNEAERKKIEAEAQGYREKVDHILLRLPNLMHETVPMGKDEKDNLEICRWGKIPQFDF